MNLLLKNNWDFKSDEGKEFSGIRDWANSKNNGFSPWNRFYLQGAMTLPVRTVTSSYALGDLDYILLVNSSSSTTITLPDASVILGRNYIVMTTGNGSAIINTTSSQTINGNITTSIPGKYFNIQLFSDGSNWVAI